jgi:hypothetical protein
MIYRIVGFSHIGSVTNYGHFIAPFQLSIICYVILLLQLLLFFSLDSVRSPTGDLELNSYIFFIFLLNV